MDPTTGCECPQAGWCARHQCLKSPILHWECRHDTQRFAERDRAQDAAIRKAAQYAADPTLRLFVESDDAQAREIARLTGRPVFSVARNGLV